MEMRTRKLKEKRNVLKETFGTLKGWKIDAQKFKDELREEDARRFAKLDIITKKSKLTQS